MRGLLLRELIAAPKLVGRSPQPANEIAVHQPSYPQRHKTRHDLVLVLARDEQAYRGTDSTVGDYFNWYYFELHLKHTCSTTGTSCIPISGNRSVSGDGTMHLWPSVAGEWFGEQIVPIEHHGIRLGAETSTVEVTKYRDGSETPVTSAPVEVRLDPSVIVVPVNVIHVIPAAAIDAASNAKAEEYADPAIYRALFDDGWSMNLETASSPSHHPEYLAGAWYNRSKDNTALTQRRLDYPYEVVLPDDVFAQCGVQFRLQSVTFVYENDPTVINTTACSSRSFIEGQTIRGYLGKWIKAATIDPGANVVYGTTSARALNAVFAPWISAKDCNVASVGDSGRIGFGYVQNNLSANYKSLTLSHELGHALDLDDFTFSGADNHLMFSGGGPAHISGCHYRDGEQLAQLPPGCAPLAGETGNGSCGTARKGAQFILSAFENGGGTWAAMDPVGTAPSDDSRWPLSWGGTAKFNTSHVSEGLASIEVPGGGYVVASSPLLRTVDVAEVGDELSLDLYLQDDQPNPYWLGSVDAFATIPAAGIYNAHLGHVELTGLPIGEWSSVSFPVADILRSAFLADFPVAQIALAVNTAQGAPAVLLDALGFGGNVEARVVPHTGPTGGGSSNAFLSFEQMGDWSASNGSASLTDKPTDGATSLTIDGTGWVEIVSRAFNTGELLGVTSTISVDLMPSANTPNPNWLGTLQMFVTCPSANVYNMPVGLHELQHLFQNEFNTLTFALPANVVSALKAPAQTCSFKYALNVTAGSGQYLLDHIAFR